MALTLTATPEPDRGRVRLEVAGNTGTTIISTLDDRTRPRQVRGADPLPAGLQVAYDYEAFIRQPTTYTVTDSTGTATATAFLQSEVPWLVHPFLPFLSSPVRVVREDGSVVEGRGTEFDVLMAASPIVLTQPVHTRAGSLRLAVDVGIERERLRDLIADGQVLLLRSPCVEVDDARWLLIRRISESHANPVTRYWDVDYRVVDRPTGAIQYDPLWTYQGVLDDAATYGIVRDTWTVYRDLVTHTAALFGW